MRVFIQLFLFFSDIAARFERDAFDTLFDHAPDKLNVVQKVRLLTTIWYQLYPSTTVKLMSRELKLNSTAVLLRLIFFIIGM